MPLIHEDQFLDSPYIEKITHGRTAGDGSVIRPAESRWHMVVAKHAGQVRLVIVGPWTAAGVVSWSGDAEILWLKFRLGTYIPHLPASQLIDRETVLPGAASRSFWLKGSTWQFPDHNNVDVFVDRLVRQELLARDPVVNTALEGHPQPWSPRTVRHRFLQSTGLTQNQIYQIERAQRAAALLAQGTSILDTVHETGYFDQPHLTRALKRWIGHTPAQLVRESTP